MIEDLRAFIALIAHGSVTRAAAHLRVTQPAITRRIQRLEAAFGGDLIDRSVKPARVSALGMRLYDRAQTVLRDLDGLRELASEDGEPDGTLRVGAVPSVSDIAAVPAIALLKRRFSKLRLEMQTGWSLQLTQKVQQGQLDAAAIMLQPSGRLPDGVSGALIGVHRAVIVAPRSASLKGTVTLRQLAAYPWVIYPEGGCICRAALRREFEARGLELNVAVADYSVERQLALVAAGAGLGFVSEMMLGISRHRGKLRVVRISDFEFDFGIWVMRPRFLGNLTAPVKLFTEVVNRHFGRSKGGAKTAPKPLPAKAMK